MAIALRLLAASSAGLILIATGCSDSGSSVASPVGTWGATANQSPQLVLAADGTLNGTDGCNLLSGTWTDEDGTVIFGSLAATEMFCEGVDTWLLQLTTATVDGDTMTVMGPDGAEVGTLDKN